MTASNAHEPLLLTYAQAAKRLGLSVRTLQRLVSARKLTVLHVSPAHLEE